MMQWAYNNSFAYIENLPSAGAVINTAISITILFSHLNFNKLLSVIKMFVNVYNYIPTLAYGHMHAYTHARTRIYSAAIFTGYSAQLKK